MLTVLLCSPCYSQQIISQRNFYINRGIVSNPGFFPGNRYDQTPWYIQYAAENPVSPAEFSRESTKLLNSLNNVKPSNPPPTVDQIRQSILDKMRSRNF